MRPLMLTLFIAASAGVSVLVSPAAWPRGAWDAADHNRDGVLTRSEMKQFGTQKSHRNGPRLMMHFDAADTNSDGIVSDEEIEIYGAEIGSKDSLDHLPPR